MRDKTAAIVVIGNEILSGKVVDSNAAFAAKELRTLGVSLQRIVVIPDDLDAIAGTVRALHSEVDVVFTSGGVGPTHDDITMEGVARGLGRTLVRHTILEEKIREYSGERIDDTRLKMADIPDGAELIFGGELNFPSVQVENIFILPGIPELFRDKFMALASRFKVDPYFLRVVYTRAVESTLALYLNDTLAAFPLVQVGSYPTLNEPDYQVRVTLESKNQQYVNQAFDHLVAQLPPEMVVRTE